MLQGIAGISFPFFDISPDSFLKKKKKVIKKNYQKNIDFLSIYTSLQAQQEVCIGRVLYSRSVHHAPSVHLSNLILIRCLQAGDTYFISGPISGPIRFQRGCGFQKLCLYLGSLQGSRLCITRAPG